MKKLFTIILSAATIALCAAGLTACKSRQKSDTPQNGSYISVTGTTVNQNGELIITYSDGTNQNLGKVKGENGNNGTNGKDGKGIADASVNQNGELIITYSDGTSQNLGKVKGENGNNGKDGKGIADASVNQNGELIITYSDGTSQNLGKVKGENGNDGTVTPCNHSYSSFTQTVAASCTSVGVSTRTCTNCGHVDYAFTPATGHDWTGEETKIIEVTCTQAGLKTVKCSTCKELTVVSAPALGHTFLDGVCTTCGINQNEEYFSFTLNGEGNGYAVRMNGDTKDRVNGVVQIPAEHGGLPVTEIDRSAFSGYRYVTQFIIPDSVQKIGRYAFNTCDSLTTIQIPKSVTVIEDSLWYRTKVESISVQAGNPAYHSDGNCLIDTSAKTLIAGCKNSVIPADGSVKNIARLAFCQTDFESFTIPEGVEKIDRQAFVSCNFGTLNISSTVNEIEDRAFNWNLKGIGKIKVAEGNERYSGAGSCLTDLTTGTLMMGSLDAVIPADGSVTKIGDFAFRSLDITSIVIPQGITEIGEYAFAQSDLTSVTLPEGLLSIGDDAFYMCNKLDEISIPDSVTAIGGSAFLYTAYYNNELNWQDGALYIDNHLIKTNDSISENFVIKQGTRTIAPGAFSISTVNSVSIPDSVVTIGDSAFFRCGNLTGVTLPESVVTIGENAFAYCNLESVTIPDSVKSIARYAFYNCEKLKTVVIGTGVETIVESAFGGKVAADRTVEFKNKQGWTRKSYVTEEETVTEEMIADPSAASALLLDQASENRYGNVYYYYYTWTRKPANV